MSLKRGVGNRISRDFCLFFHYEFGNRVDRDRCVSGFLKKRQQNPDPGDQKVTDPEHSLKCCYKNLSYLNIVVIVLFFGFLD